MGRPRSLTCGVGINDANYVTCIREDIGCVDGKRKRGVVWVCPFYVKWRDMLQRCYSPKVHERYGSYVGCYVVEEWLTFSNFKRWMEKQDWEGKQLDKDILFLGNKEYGPSRCVFVNRDNFDDMDAEQRAKLELCTVYILDIPDEHNWGHPHLEEIILEQYNAAKPYEM